MTIDATQEQTVTLDDAQIRLIAELTIRYRRDAEGRGDYAAAALCDTIIDELGAPGEEG
jgi:hypothetical protein